MVYLSRSLVSSALAGAATGSRSMTGLAALTLAARPGTPSQPDATLARPWAKALAGVLAATEYVTDQLPGTPSRLAPAGLGARLVGAAVSAVVIARRAPGARAGTGGGLPPVPALRGPAPAAACVLAATGAAVTAAWAGARWRAWASARLGGDRPGALIEDAAAVTLAAAAARRP
jgi:uncharacterized membrane protein